MAAAPELECGSGMACWRRLRDWQRAGVWDLIHFALLDWLARKDQIDWSRAVVDSCSIRAVHGGDHTGPNPTDRAKRGSKRHLICDGRGVPLAVRLTGANRNDSQEALALVDAIPPLHGERGRPRQRPDCVLGDRGYDAAAIRRGLRARHIVPWIAMRRTAHGSGLGRWRWVVERTFAWLNQFRRLRVRYDKRADIHEAFLSLGCALICWQSLGKTWRTAWGRCHPSRASIDEVDVFPKKSSYAACLGAVRGGRRWTSVNATAFIVTYQRRVRYPGILAPISRQMPLTPGIRIGPYEIAAKIGEGGMGEVYRASDMNLGRDVAIKVLSDAFAQDPERLARFEREAKTLASLNHANIAIIHGQEKANGILALVMELVEGPTLADRIAQGPLRIDEAIPVARQIAEALEAAHAQGIIHRDLKPANIKLRPDGTVKVLDFGVAKVMEPPATTSAGVSQSPTVTSPPQTMSGVILGTPAYMSPEQARGKPFDKRADVWAFGCTLYEMITGQRAFEGAGVTETLAAVLHKEPDWSRLPASTPPSIRRLLTRTLQKEPSSRLRDIGDARFDIQDARAGGPNETESFSSASRRQVVLRLVAAVAFGGLLATSAAIVMWPSEPAIVTRTILGWRSGTEPRAGEMSALSDDGSQLVYVGRDRRLWVRALDDLEPRDLPGTEEARLPFFSPDGDSVAFVTAAGALKVVPVRGGSARTLIPRQVAVDSLDWASDGMIYFGRPTEGVSKIVSAGGAVEPVSQPEAVGITHTRVDVLPNGKGAFITINKESANTAEIGVLDFATGKVEALFRGVQARFAASGHVVYVTSNGTLHAAPFDQNRLRITGSAVPLIENVSVALYSPGSPFAISDTGTLLYQSERQPQSELVWVSMEGKETRLGPETWSGQFFSLSLSPDARRVAVTLTTGTRQDVWTRSLETGAMHRLTLDRDGSLNYRPKWTPDGLALTYLSNRSGVAGELWRQPANGSAPAERLVSDGPIIDEGFISRDGRWVVYRAGGSELRGRDIKGVPTGNGAERTPQALVATGFEEYAPTLSPDGRWLAYVSDESNRPEVYVRPFPETQAAVWQVSSGGGRGPLWAHNGRQLFYQNERSELVAVQVRPSAAFAWDPPRVLFDLSRYELNPWHPTYDVTPDGGRFLMARSVPDRETELVLTLNWHQELKRLVPTR